MKKSFVAVAASLLLAGGANANLLINGDFEADPVSGNITTVNAGAPGITGWTVGGTSVDLIAPTGFSGAIQGTSVDLAGTPGPGSIQQTFKTVVGQAYTLTFDYFRNNLGADLIVLFGDSDPGNVFERLTVSGLAAPASATFSWIAQTTTGRVRFNLDDPLAPGVNPFQGPVVDNVMVVTAVPEPSTYALMLAGLGVVGYMARRRKVVGGQAKLVAA